MFERPFIKVTCHATNKPCLIPVDEILSIVQFDEYARIQFIHSESRYVNIKESIETIEGILNRGYRQ